MLPKQMRTDVPPVYLIKTRMEAWLLFGAVCTGLLLIAPALLTHGSDGLVLWTGGAWAWYTLGVKAYERYQLWREVKSFRQELESIDSH